MRSLRNSDGLIRSIRTAVPNIDQAVISVHCHNDLGLAVAKALPR